MAAALLVMTACSSRECEQETQDGRRMEEWQQTKSVLTHTAQATATLCIKTKQIKEEEEEDTLLVVSLLFFHHLLSFRLDFLPAAAAAA